MENAFNNISAFDTSAISLNQRPQTLLNGKHKLNQAQAQKAAEDFEAFFLSKMAETMFEGISTDGMFGGGHAEKVYRSLLINEYGKAMAKTGSVGVADEVMRSILQMQEAQSRNAQPEAFTN